MSEWLADLESTCSALGTWDGGEYVKDDDCLECLRDLVRFLRRDDESHAVRRRLGEIQVLQSDLLPLLRHHSEDPELLDMLLRLLVNLTNPELLLFREELPEDRAMRNYYMQLQQHRQSYKRAFVDESAWRALSAKMSSALKVDPAERTEDEQLVMERLLILVRNVLQVPKDSLSQSRTDNDINVHDQVLWMLHKSGMEDLLLYVASSEAEGQFCLHVLEIISLMFKEQDPSVLSSATLTRSKVEKEEDARLLAEAARRDEEKRRKRAMTATARHPRFGGTFVASNVKSLNDGRALIVHRPLRDLNAVVDFDRDKRPKKVARNKVAPSDDVQSVRRSTLSVRLFLKEFCIEFLGGAYNALMRQVKDALVRQRAQQNDESYYLWAIRFFLEFNRGYRFRPELVSETVSKSVFHYVHQQVETYRDNFDHEKKNRPACLLWGRRIHLALRAYHELLSTLVAMENSGDEEIKKSGKVIRAQVFFEPEYRELTLSLFNLFTPDKLSRGFLRDLVEANHVLLKILEHMSKSKHLVVGKRIAKKSGKKSCKKPSEAAPSAELTQRESNESTWDAISSSISSLLQEDEPRLPTLAPFDAALEIAVEEQKVGAVYNVRRHLVKGRVAHALALLRAARDVWPEGDVFGSEDADPEEEFMALREILFAEVEKPSWLQIDEEDGSGTNAGAQDTGENEAGDGGVENEEENENEEEEEEEEYGQVETYVSEQEFDFRGFVLRFAVKSVSSAYAQLLSGFARNSDFTNHCLVKMFHRVAFDCRMPALLFHVSIFRTFQKVNETYKLMSKDGGNPGKALVELRTFAKYLLRQFFECAEKNKKVFMELCFWKTTSEASEVTHGYDESGSSKTARQKASFWSEEDEEKLERVFHQFKEMREKDGDRSDMLDAIEAFFQGSGKTRRQIAKKLKAMNLIQDTKELKAVRSRRAGGGGGGGRRRRARRGSGEGNANNIGDDGQIVPGGDENGEFLSRSFVSTDESSSEDEDERQRPSSAASSNAAAAAPADSATGDGETAAPEQDGEEMAKRKEDLKRRQEERWRRAFGSDEDDSDDDDVDAGADKKSSRQRKKKVVDEDDVDAGADKKSSRQRKKRVNEDSDDQDDGENDGAGSANKKSSRQRKKKVVDDEDSDEDDAEIGNKKSSRQRKKKVVDDNSDEDDAEIGKKKSSRKSKKRVVNEDSDDDAEDEDKDNEDETVVSNKKSSLRGKKKRFEDSSDDEETAAATETASKKKRKTVLDSDDSDNDAEPSAKADNGNRAPSPIASSSPDKTIRSSPNQTLQSSPPSSPINRSLPPSSSFVSTPGGRSRSPGSVTATPRSRSPRSVTATPRSRLASSPLSSSPISSRANSRLASSRKRSLSPTQTPSDAKRHRTQSPTRKDSSDEENKSEGDASPVKVSNKKKARRAILSDDDSD